MSAPPFALICFDLDGTIVDSEPLHQRAKERLAAELGYREPLRYADFVGKPNAVFWEPILRALGQTGETAQTMERRQYELILRMAAEERHKPTPGLNGLLRRLTAEGTRLAVCSSSDRWYVLEMLRLLELAPRFDFVVGGDEVARKKPAPDIYCRALEIGGAAAAGAVAVEDSAAGVAAATAAGIPCIGYRNPTSGEQDLAGAVFTAARMEEIGAYLQSRSTGTRGSTV